MLIIKKLFRFSKIRSVIDILRFCSPKQIDKKHSYLNEIDLVKYGNTFLYMFKQDLAYSGPYIPKDLKLANNPSLANDASNHEMPIWTSQRDSDPQSEMLYNTLSYFRKTFNNFHVVDIGANYGIVTLSMVRILKSLQINSPVYSFDPGVTSELIEYNLALNHAENNVKFFPYAVGKSNNYNLMYYDLGHSENNRLLNPKATSFSKPVKTIRLDDFLENTDLGLAPAYIKIDTQGYEPFVVEGLSKLIDQQIPCILYTEFNPKVLRSPIFGNNYSGATFLNILSNNFTIFHYTSDKGYVEIKKEELDNFSSEVENTSPYWTDLFCVSNNIPDFKNFCHAMC